MNLLSRIFASLVFTVLSVAAQAGEMPFDQKAFDDLRAAGKPLALHIYSSWCMTCRRQASIVSPILEQPEFKDLTLMRADHKTERALLQRFNIPGKSTFVAFKGMNEVARSTGDTNGDNIAALLRKAL